MKHSHIVNMESSTRINHLPVCLKYLLPVHLDSFSMEFNVFHVELKTVNNVKELTPVLNVGMDISSIPIKVQHFASQSLKIVCIISKMNVFSVSCLMYWMLTIRVLYHKHVTLELSTIVLFAMTNISPQMENAQLLRMDSGSTEEII